MTRYKAKHQKDKYKWSTNNSNPYLKSIYWPKVKAGITKAAKELKLKILQCDIAWLNEFKGQYCRYMPKDCRKYMDTRSNKRYRFKKEKTVIEEICKLGSIVGPSPRYSFSDNPGNTDLNYETQLRLLWNFLAMVGSKRAYTSMLILLQEKTVPNPPAVDANLVAACINHKWLKYGSPLIVNGTPITDVNNEPMTCEESLACPDAFSTFWAALTNIHLLRGNDGNYLNQCDLCNKNYITKKRSRYRKCNASCILHPYPTGIVTNNILLSKLRRDINRSPKAKSHQKHKEMHCYHKIF